MIRTLRDHWPEYLCEAAELGLFMISAGLFTILLWHPNSPIPNMIPSETVRRMLTGIAMGSTAIAFVLMSVVLRVSNTPHIARYTGLFAGALVATYITLEAPFSGMSMNPARTFGSAFVGHLWTGLWIYFTAPVLAMQLAAMLYLHSKGVVYCAKYHHYNRHRCIFNCRFPELLEREQAQKQAREPATI